MNYLLDTHTFLWMLSEPDRLSAEAKKAIRHPHHSVFVSAVTGVEIAIKQRLGKLDAPENLEEEIAPRGLQHLPLRYGHGALMATLPVHHQDPFDRMILAQAISEQLILITHDRKMEPYEVRVLWT